MQEPEGIRITTAANFDEQDSEWRFLTAYPKFLFCDDGRVLNTKTGRFPKGHLAEGYRLLNLRRQGNGCPLIHRLIARAFHPNPLNLPCVNHKNGDRADNRASNLEWCTHRYNTQGLNKRSGFGNIRERKNGRKRFQAAFRKNGAKKFVCKHFYSREEAQAYLDQEAEIARSELRVDM